MKILMPATSRLELVLSAVLAVTCHAAFFGLMPEGSAGPPEIMLSAQRENLEVTLVPALPPVRERLIEPARERKAVTARDKARTPARERGHPVARAATREPVRDRRQEQVRERVVEAPRRKLPVRQDAPRPEECTLQAQRDERRQTGDSNADVSARDATYSMKTARLVYPRWALEMGIEGRLVVAVNVLSDGKVSEIRLKSSSGHRILDRDAIRQVKENLLFQPALKKGRPVAGWKEISFNYFVRDGSASVGNE
jgi:TonB family protein